MGRARLIVVVNRVTRGWRCGPSVQPKGDRRYGIMIPPNVQQGPDEPVRASKARHAAWSLADSAPANLSLHSIYAPDSTSSWTNAIVKIQPSAMTTDQTTELPSSTSEEMDFDLTSEDDRVLCIVSDSRACSSSAVRSKSFSSVLEEGVPWWGP